MSWLLIRRCLSFAIIAAVVLMPRWALSQGPSQQLQSLVQDPGKLMAEEHRSAVKKVVILPGASPPSGAVTGSYEKETDGLLDGIDRGRGYGTVNRDIGGIPVRFPIPILTVPGAILGGLRGSVTRQVQDFRDALTNDLAEAANTQLSNDALATDVFWRLRDVPSLEPKVFALSTPIPADTDAILYVSFSDSSINVEGNEATITFSASATLRRLSDGQDLYQNQVLYQDTDTLSNWTKNDNAAWRDYANFARHYVGREIAGELFERVDVQHALRPTETDTVVRIKKDEWRSKSDTSTPTLAWEIELRDDDSPVPWANSIDETNISYDVEIYDMHQLVYSAKKIQGSRFTIDRELEACKTYRWSVRPIYKVDGEVRYGEWMRSNGDAANGNVGKMASEAAAYIYDFASLEIKCRRR
jgi:hypothetical protein